MQANELITNEINAILSDAGAFRASVNRSTAEFLFELVSETKPSVVVEIGCYAGFSTLHIANALKLNGSGGLYAFDLDTRKSEYHVKRAGLSSEVRFIEGNSAVEGRNLLESLSLQVDILFIDGDHTRRGCARDVETYLPYLKPGGYLVLHDIFPDVCGWLGPRFVLDNLKKSTDETGGLLFVIEELTLKDPYGVALCKKMGECGAKAWRANGMGAGEYFLATSRISQFLEIARFEGKTTPLQIVGWGLSKWKRIGSHW